MADESSVSVPTLYKFFGDKEALLTEAVIAGVTDLLEVREQRGISRIFGLFEACVAQLNQGTLYAQSLMYSFLDSSKPAVRRDRVLGILVGRFALALDELRDDDHLAPCANIESLVGMLVGHCVFVALRWMDGQLPEEQLRRELDYGASVMLLGIVQGEAREEICLLLEDCSRSVSGTVMRAQVSESNTLPASYRRAEDSKSAFET